MAMTKFSPAERCPAYRVAEDIAAAVGDKQRRDEIETYELISRGTPIAQATTGIDGGMNLTFLAAVKSHGGPGATIRTASGTIPAHVNPPAEPGQTATAVPEFRIHGLSPFHRAYRRRRQHQQRRPIRLASSASCWVAFGIGRRSGAGDGVKAKIRPRLYADSRHKHDQQKSAGFGKRKA
jgi:hypothetical protein